jgi:hypothetical protein
MPSLELMDSLAIFHNFHHHMGVIRLVGEIPMRPSAVIIDMQFCRR